MRGLHSWKLRMFDWAGNGEGSAHADLQARKFLSQHLLTVINSVSVNSELYYIYYILFIICT